MVKQPGLQVGVDANKVEMEAMQKGRNFYCSVMQRQRDPRRRKKG